MQKRIKREGKVNEKKMLDMQLDMKDNGFLAATRGRRKSLEKEKDERTSDVSITLDDLQDLRNELASRISIIGSDPQAIMNALELTTNSYDGDLEEDEDNDDDCDFWTLDLECSESLRIDGKFLSNSSLPSVTKATDGCREHDTTAINGRKVRFDLFHVEIRTIERVDSKDYSSLFYCCHELQKMIDDYRAELKYGPSNEAIL